MTTSKFPRRVLQVAYEAACRALSAYRYRFGLQKYAQPQLLACLVLKEFLRLDYRGLADDSDRTRQIALENIYLDRPADDQYLLTALPDARDQFVTDPLGVFLVACQLLLERSILPDRPHHQDPARQAGGDQRPDRTERQGHANPH